MTMKKRVQILEQKTDPDHQPLLVIWTYLVDHSSGHLVEQLHRALVLGNDTHESEHITRKHSEKDEAFTKRVKNTVLKIHGHEIGQSRSWHP